MWNVIQFRTAAMFISFAVVAFLLLIGVGRSESIYSSYVCAI